MLTTVETVGRRRVDAAAEDMPEAGTGGAGPLNTLPTPGNRRNGQASGEEDRKDGRRGD